MGIVLIIMLFVVIVNWSIDKIDDSTEKINEEIFQKNILPETNEPLHPLTTLTLREQIAAHLKKGNVKFWFSDENPHFKIGYHFSPDDIYDLYFNVPKNEKYIEFVCEVWTDIPDDAIDKICEIIARINQCYKFGYVNFFFESRLVTFNTTMILYENELTENKLELYIHDTVQGAQNCRPIIKMVLYEGVEPVIAMMNINAL